jgi:energy-coupling factor transport system permease protein
MKSAALLGNLDDRVKVWMAASAGVAAIYCIDWRIQALILLASLVLCLLAGAVRFALYFSLFLIGLVALSAALARLAPAWSPLVWGFCLFFLKFMPMLSMAFFLAASLNTSRFLRSLEGLKAPAGLVLPVGVCLRFMPSVASECRQVAYAMRMRGIGLRPASLLRRPFETLGYLMVPLLIRSLAVGEELARAAVARGIEAPGPKTSYYDTRFKLGDGLVLLAWSAALVLLILLDNHIHAGQLAGA